MSRAAVAIVAFLSIAIAHAAPPPGACAVLPATITKPESIGLKPAPIAALVQAAKAAGTSGFAVLKDGKLIAAFNEQQPYSIYSVTKPMVSVAVSRLFTEGKWTNIDLPIGQLLPPFTADPKGAVTLRQLMSHTSGIRDARDANNRVLKQWNEARDWVEAARLQPAQDPPGTVFKYNNLGPALVAAAVEHATGERLDRFLRRTVFDPLCIKENTTWFTDPAGHAAGYTGLSISAFDLAKIGQLILNTGQWGANRILSEESVRNSAYTSSQTVNKKVGLFLFMTGTPRSRFPSSSTTAETAASI